MPGNNADPQVLVDVFCYSLISVVDTNDRFLRKITIGQANTEKGFVRQVCKSG